MKFRWYMVPLAAVGLIGVGFKTGFLELYWSGDPCAEINPTERDRIACIDYKAMVAEMKRMK
jgi:hypothetical protein